MVVRRQALKNLLWNHGVENEKLLDVLERKFKKIYKKEQVLLRELDQLRVRLPAIQLKHDKLRTELSAMQLEYGALLIDRNRLREVLHKLSYAGDAPAALAKEGQ